MVIHFFVNLLNCLKFVLINSQINRSGVEEEEKEEEGDNGDWRAQGMED